MCVCVCVCGEGGRGLVFYLVFSPYIITIIYTSKTRLWLEYRAVTELVQQDRHCTERVSRWN